MKAIVVLMALLLTSCSAYQAQKFYYSKEGYVEYQHAIANSDYCFKTSQGIEVRQFEAKCPPKSILNTDIDRFYERVGVSPASREKYKDLVLVYVSQNITCGPYNEETNFIVYGCSNTEANKSVIKLRGTRASWGITTCHELAHFFLIWEFPSSLGDPGHLVVPFWHLAEAIDE